MNIYQALNKLPDYKRIYFQWKHQIRFTDEANNKTEEEMLKEINRKTTWGLKRWERSAEYRALVLLLIESKIGKDIEDIYYVTSKKARDGDEKAIKLLLDLHKQIQKDVKIAEDVFENIEKDEESDESDGLDLS
ncbi:MAG TPA: hypothetical protein VK091_06325 [Virgibacillus sp.]|nr:hypothetical protein [Virgibacillus sp.]